MERLINDEWQECLEEDLVSGDYIRTLMGAGWHERAYIIPPKESTERKWRDSELSGTDWIVPVTDHPQHADYLTYRQALRDYPAQVDFPNGSRPTL